MITAFNNNDMNGTLSKFNSASIYNESKKLILNNAREIFKENACLIKDDNTVIIFINDLFRLENDKLVSNTETIYLNDVNFKRNPIKYINEYYHLKYTGEFCIITIYPFIEI